MFVTTTVFDPELAKKAVHIKGFDVNGKMWDGFYLVKCSGDQNINVINPVGNEFRIHMDEFTRENGLKLKILELPQPKEIALPFDDLDVLDDEPIKPPHKTGFKRRQGAKNFRSDLQIKVDNNHLEYMLQENIDPMKLEDIILRMRENHGHWHWNEKNGSGFVQFAMKAGKRIKKFGFGQYGYDWEAAK